MGWQVGFQGGQWVGYGVPAICDHPDCGVEIDRGVSYRCGGLDPDGCGRFFCEDHGGGDMCERCKRGEPAFTAKPDTPEWTNHLLTDPSWESWRDMNPDLVRSLVGGGS